MPLYLWEASYTADGTKGLLKEGGTKRRAAVQPAIEKAGGTLHAFYYAFGGADLYGIAEFLIILQPRGSLAEKRRDCHPPLHRLLTPEEMDAAAKKTVSYRPPGA
jgi:hypothetical protein